MKDFGCICLCDVYRTKSGYCKPHQVGRGRCSGAQWAGSIFRYEQDHEYCANCHCNRGSYCEVAVGAESITQCPVYQDAIFRGVYPRYFHPLTTQQWENILEEQNNVYYHYCGDVE